MGSDNTHAEGATSVQAGNAEKRPPEIHANNITRLPSSYQRLRTIIDNTPALFADVEPSIAHEFKQWLPDNMPIYQAAVEQARLARREFKRFSMKAVIEALRWRTDLRDSKGEFKVSDHNTSCLARLIMAAEADLRGFFRVKKGGAANG